MENTVYIKSDFGCVYLLNGAFCETAEGFRYPSDQPLYITVLPLSAHLLPYTVKLLGKKPLSNEKLAAVFLDKERLMVKLFPRYAYLYSPQSPLPVETAGAGSAEKLFACIKAKNFTEARKYMSESLSSGIDDASLYDFFNDYTQIIKDSFERGQSNAYFLIRSSGTSDRFIFETKSGFIDDIVCDE